MVYLIIAVQFRMNRLELNRGRGGGNVRSVLHNLSQNSGRRAAVAGNSENLDREGTDDVKVDESATTVLGKTNVKEEDSLKKPVKGDPVKDGVAPEFNNAERGVDDPVSQEVSVIISSLGLKSFEGVVTWDNQGGKVGKKLANSAKVEEDEEEVSDTQAESYIGLGNTKLFLNLVKSRESLQFLYEKASENSIATSEKFKKVKKKPTLSM